MALEIINYKTTTKWELETFFTGTIVDNQWPLVVGTLSTWAPDSLETVWSDFIGGKRKGRPTQLRQSSNDSVTAMIGAKLGRTREIFRMEAACSTSLYAFYIAGLISQDKNSPVIVVCGDNLVGNYDNWYFQSLGAISQETGRPFDRSSCGFKMGTGICQYIVKHHSVKTSDYAIATIDDVRFYTDPNLITNPGNVDNVIEQLGNIDYSKFDLWNAHATGTPVGDKFEYAFFENTIKQDIPIIGYKGHIGHCMTAAGGMEIALMLDDMQNGYLRGNNIVGDKIISDSRIITEPIKWNFKKVLKTSLGFGGRTAICTVSIE
jgi:3-oxoacyl-[acyl-carrier-protein] synthase II